MNIIENNIYKSKIFFWSLPQVKSVAIVLGISGVILALVTILLTSTTRNALSVPPIDQSDHYLGNSQAKVVLIEYSDFQCPTCAIYYQLIKRLATELGEKVAFVYRHFPITNHRNSQFAAEAAEAAGKQGKFWEMHDLLFEKQPDWSQLPQPRDVFIGYAQELGLNSDQFTSDLNLEEIKTKILSDVDSGRKALIYGTPTFFLNGKKITPQGYEDLKKLLEQELAAQKN